MHYLLYAITLLISSSLLFVVQPMVAKMVQPVLGGTPAVWNTAMVFFQALLLGGYLYAHLTTKWLGTRKQAFLHLAVLAIGLAFLPVAFEPPADPASLEMPMLWLLGTLLIGVGWPFFVISTSAPLLQKWFSTIEHPRAGDPYHLYSASNLGSIVALLAYPFIIEPRIGLLAQTTLWTVAYGILCISVLVCAVVLWKSPERKESKDKDEQPPESARPVDWKRRGRWIIWAFIPSSMMLSVTTFITTDVAPMPLLWIPPLVVYMLSFILVFARREYVPFGVWMALFPIFLVALITLLLTGLSNPLWVVTAVNFGGLFVFCMVFHGLLARDRPHTDKLTDFYLWMSVGGVLGGSFNALLAPVVFDRLLEYPLLLVAAALFFPAAAYRRRSVRWPLIASLGFAAVFTVASYVLGTDLSYGMMGPLLIGYIVLLTGPAIADFVRPSLVRVAVAAVALAATIGMALPEPYELHRERSFFGVHVVYQVPAEESGYGGRNLLHHGTTLHGLQYLDEEAARKPASYYHVEGPLGQIFDVMRARNDRNPIGVVGLGTGGIGVYYDPEDPREMDFFEIDPAVEGIARNPDYFDFLDFCGSDCDVILGDGRLQLQVADDDRYEMIIMDAYSSTAIPVHLLTLEAIEMYLEKLRPDGVLAFHISNRHLDLEPPLTRLAAEMGLVVRYRPDNTFGEELPDDHIGNHSDWLIMARSEEDLGEMATDDRWLEPSLDNSNRVWTDDYANVLETMR